MYIQDKFEEIIANNKRTFLPKETDIVSAGKECAILCLKEKLSLLYYLQVSGIDNLILNERIINIQEQLKELEN